MQQWDSHRFIDPVDHLYVHISNKYVSIVTNWWKWSPKAAVASSNIVRTVHLQVFLYFSFFSKIYVRSVTSEKKALLSYLHTDPLQRIRSGLCPHLPFTLLLAGFPLHKVTLTSSHILAVMFDWWLAQSKLCQRHFTATCERREGQKEKEIQPYRILTLVHRDRREMWHGNDP